MLRTKINNEHILYKKGKGIFMGKFHRYRLPPWAIRFIFLLEKALLPIIIFQALRTLIFMTTLDVFLLIMLMGLFFAFYLEWI